MNERGLLANFLLWRLHGLLTGFEKDMVAWCPCWFLRAEMRALFQQEGRSCYYYYYYYYYCYYCCCCCYYYCLFGRSRMEERAYVEMKERGMHELAVSVDKVADDGCSTYLR